MIVCLELHFEEFTKIQLTEVTQYKINLSALWVIRYLKMSLLMLKQQSYFAVSTDEENDRGLQIQLTIILHSFDEHGRQCLSIRNKGVLLHWFNSYL